jgi:hypothetical protein
MSVSRMMSSRLRLGLRSSPRVRRAARALSGLTTKMKIAAATSGT